MRVQQTQTNPGYWWCQRKFYIPLLKDITLAIKISVRSSKSSVAHTEKVPNVWKKGQCCHTSCAFCLLFKIVFKITCFRTKLGLILRARSRSVSCIANICSKLLQKYTKSHIRLEISTPHTNKNFCIRQKMVANLIPISVYKLSYYERILNSIQVNLFTYVIPCFIIYSYQA